jgi:hypothetical protein
MHAANCDCPSLNVDGPESAVADNQRPIAGNLGKAQIEIASPLPSSQ